MRMHYSDAFSLSSREIDVGGSVDSTGVGIGTLLRAKQKEKERLTEKNEEGRLLSSLSAGIPKQKAAMLVQRWTICKSVAGRGHDVATSSSRFRLRS